MIAELAATAQVSTRVLLPRFGPKPLLPDGMILAAASMLMVHQLAVNSKYASHVLPYSLILREGFGLIVPNQHPVICNKKR